MISTPSCTAFFVSAANLATTEVDDEAPERFDPLVEAVPVAALDLVAPLAATVGFCRTPSGASSTTKSAELDAPVVEIWVLFPSWW